MKLLFLLVFLSGLVFARAQNDSANYETGIASFYAKKFEGRKCSSGCTFRNDSVVIVTINDRLPQRSKRSIDLTRKAAAQLNFIPKGLAKVKIEVLKDPIP